MKKILLGLLASVFVLGALALFRGEAIALSYMAGKVETRTSAELADILVPEMHVRIPENGAGPFPVIIQMHGCGGLSLEHHGGYEDLANEAGYAAVIVSSNAPRGFDQDGAFAEVCAGKALLGQERAGDILIAMEHVLKRDDIDADQVFLAGWSHGAWTVMDYLTFADDELPYALSDYSGPRPAIKGAVLFYPYCSLGSRTRVYGWQQSPEVLALMGDADTIVNYPDCAATLDTLDTVEIERKVYEGADHAFDHGGLPANLAHWHNAEYAADARARFSAFLARMKD